MKEQIPKYFLYKMKYAKPYQFMQMNNFILMKPQDQVLYKLPDGSVVYGGDVEVIITDYSSDYSTYFPEWYNPKTKVWTECCPESGKDWLFAKSNIDYSLHDKKFESICYDSDDGYIQFDLIKWLHKNISPTFQINEDFYYYGHVFIGESCYDLSRCLEGYGEVKNSVELVVVCSKDNDVYNITQNLLRFFEKKKLPDNCKSVFNKIKDGQLTLEDFVVWVKG